ncbi:MAG: CHASE4 domain-containing protein [archaeon]
MKLQLKILLAVLGLTIVLSAIFAIVASSIMQHQFTTVEEETAQSTITLLSNAVEREISDIDVSLHDYSSWDATYAYAEQENPAYIEEDMTQSVFTNLNMDLVIITNTTDVLYAETTTGQDNLTAVQESDMYTDMLAYITTLLNYDVYEHDLGEGKHGMLLLNGKIFLFAIRDVLPSNESGTRAGYMLMGRFLDQQQLSKLSALTQLPLSITIEAEQTLPLVIIDANTMKGNLPLYDVQDKQIAVMSTTIERTISQHGREAILLIIIFLLLYGIIMVVSGMFFISRMVTSRIMKLADELHKISRGEKTTLTATIQGNDEISYLSITLKQTMDNLQNLTAIQQSLFNVIPDAYFLFDNDGKQLDAKRTERLGGAALPPEQLTAAIQETLQKNSAAFTFTASGKTFDAKCALQDKNVVVLVRQQGDATVFKETQAALTKVSEELKKHYALVQAGQDEFSSQLRTPLEALAKHLTRVKDHPEVLKQVASISKFIHNMTEGLHQRDAVLIKDAVEEVVDNLRILAEEKKLTFTINVEGKVIQVDKLLLEQILYNLLGNAIAFTNQGGITIEATYQDKVVLKVKDTGIGLSEDKVKTLFSSASGEKKGLSIAKTLADKIGGTICVESQLGKGSTFTITFPV